MITLSTKVQVRSTRLFMICTVVPESEMERISPRARTPVSISSVSTPPVRFWNPLAMLSNNPTVVPFVESSAAVDAQTSAGAAPAIGRRRPG